MGVELYTVQQQLAKLQMTLEQTHDNYNVVTKIREQVRACRVAVAPRPPLARPG